MDFDKREKLLEDTFKIRDDSNDSLNSKITNEELKQEIKSLKKVIKKMYYKNIQSKHFTLQQKMGIVFMITTGVGMTFMNFPLLDSILISMMPVNIACLTIWSMFKKQ